MNWKNEYSKKGYPHKEWFGVDDIDWHERYCELLSMWRDNMDCINCEMRVLCDDECIVVLNEEVKERTGENDDGEKV